MTRITISINAPDERRESEIVTLDIPPGMTVGETKELIKAETNFSESAPQFFLNGDVLSGDERTLEEAGIKDGEMLVMLIPRGGGAGPSAPPPPQRKRRRDDVNSDEVETTRLNLLGNPQSLARLREQQPELAAAADDPARFREAWQAAMDREKDRERERQYQMALLNEDPFNVEAQRKIEEIIRQDRVTENLQHAMEHNPEVFGSVTMLYINAEVNGHPVKAFVDSGAQATIMSPRCAEMCGITRLIDRRFKGIAKGVGTAEILGRVHHAEIKIGNAIMPCMFTVMEGKDVDLLFGLDMLKRYQACIDLKRNMLVFEGNDVPFLPESEIPRQYEEAQLDEPTLAGPNGTEIGTRSGAVRPAGTSASAHSGTPKGPPVAASSTPSLPPNVTPEAVEQLQSLGFSRQQAIEALRATDGNIEHAAGLLFPQ